MSRYFSRLVERAGGAVAPVSMTPGLKRGLAGETAGDPFETVAPLETAPSVPSSPRGIAPHPPLFAPVPQAVRVPPVRTVTLPPLGPIAFEPPMASPTPLQHVVERKVIPAMIPPTKLPEVRIAPPEGVPLHNEEAPKLSPITLPHPTLHLAERDAKRQEALPPEPVRRTEPREEREHVAPPLPVIVRETKQILAPPPVEPRATAPPEPQQPRLIIGRMRIDVVPAPPQLAAPRVVRVVEHRPAAGRTAPLSSPLRFGLGQM